MAEYTGRLSLNKYIYDICTDTYGPQEHQTNQSKRNQPWIFIGRTDAEVLILWLPDTKRQLIGKDPDTGKDWGQVEKGATENEMAEWH